MRDQRRELAERLRERAGELEEMIFDRICALEGFPAAPHQLRGLRDVVRSSVEHGLVAVELGERRSPEPPPAVIAHARKAAWRSVSTPTLHERYTAGYSIFRNFLLREAGSVDLACEIQISTDVVFERLIRAVGAEHEQEVQRRVRSTDLQRFERVKQLLSGDLLEAPDLRYPFDGVHLGVVASGPELSSVIPRLLRPLGSHTLIVTSEHHKAWAWLRVGHSSPSSDLWRLMQTGCPDDTRVSFGEPAAGLAGWRRTHRQAAAAFRLIPLISTPFIRYGDVAVLASMAKDDLLKLSLKEIYLVPLASERDGGHALCSTLRAYLEAERNATSTAAALGVSRQTVTNRLRTVEDLLARPLSQCLRGLDAALQLELDNEL